MWAIFKKTLNFLTFISSVLNATLQFVFVILNQNIILFKFKDMEIPKIPPPDYETNLNQSLYINTSFGNNSG